MRASRQAEANIEPKPEHHVIDGIHYVRCGTGKPLLLLHGLGNSWYSWQPILNKLAAQRTVFAVDLPGFGSTEIEQTKPATFADVTDTMIAFIDAIGQRGIDVVGSSMGGQLALVLAKRGGITGGTVALNPAGFWSGWKQHLYYAIIYSSVRGARLLLPLVPTLAQHAWGRALLFSLHTARPWRLSPDLVEHEVRAYATAPAFDAIIHSFVYGKEREGAPANSITEPLLIGWGCRDRVCSTRQVERAAALYPDAELHYFANAGHLPHWDEPEEVAALILDYL